MEMGRPGNGGGKLVSFDDAIGVSSGRRRTGGSSLSSYLDMGRDADGGGGRATTPRPSLPPAHAMAASRRRTFADGELDVFAAERYFKGAMDVKEGFSAVQLVQTPLVETTAAAARPPAVAAEEEAVVMAKPSSTRAASMASFTASSASSVANSETALFRPGGPGPRRRRRSSRCCVKVGVLMGACSGKRSVRVDGCTAREAAADAAAAVPAAAAAAGIDWYRELRMHKAAALGLSAGDGGNSHHGHGMVAAAGLPPSLNLGTAKVAAVVGREVTATTGDEEKPEKEAAAAELSFSSSTRRRSSFTLVAPVRAAASVPATASGRVGEPGGGAGKDGRGGGGGAHHLHDGGGDGDGDDGGSESSSDLFEIKSLMIGDCPYEPSEASIQWSVVTADASERGDRVHARWGGGGGARGPVPVVAGRQVRGRRAAGILAGCASHRAVDVSAATTTTTKAGPNAAAAVVPVAMQQQRRSEGFQKARRNGA